MVVAYANKQGGAVSRSPCSLASRLLRWFESLDLHFATRYLPGHSSVLADLLSRRDQVIEAAWSLHPQVATSLRRAWGSPSLDLFTTYLTAVLPLCCSLVPGPRVVLEDAFRLPWDHLGMYGFLPFLSSDGWWLESERPQSLHASGRPPLAGEGVVHRPSPSADPTTSRAALVGPAVATAPLQPVPPRRPRAEPSRVVTLQRILQKSGFSRGTAIEMSGCIKTSTSRLYQAKWMLFCGWCRGRGVAPVNATIPLTIDFLVHLHRAKSLSISAVKGYRSALKGMDLADFHEISLLLRSFSKSARPEELRPSAWDVTLILQGLTRAPYESLQTSDERFITQKMLFLLALASAKRLGELHAFSYRVSHSRDCGEVSSFVAGFMAKTQEPSSSAPQFEGFTVLALSNSSTNCNGSLLCPVRAVRC